MGFFRRLFGGGGARSGSDPALHVYVKCNRCGAPVHVRINTNNDLSAEYDDDSGDSYIVRKEVMDDRCFRLMRAEIRFDARRNETGRTIDGGTFISEAEYNDLAASRSARSTS